MIINPAYGLLFVHVPKTAGLSLAARLYEISGRPARSRLKSLVSKLPVRRDPAGLQPPIHASLLWAQRRLDPELFGRLHKFAVVRNPFDRTVSYYEYIRTSPRHHRHNWIQDKDFDAYVDHLSRRPEGVVTQLGLLTDARGDILADRLMRFETLAADVASLWQDLGLPGRPDLPHRNPTTRSRGEYYSRPETVDAVARIFRKDIEAFGYDGPTRP